MSTGQCERRRDRLTGRLLITFITAYILLAAVGHLRHGEIYPFATWSLFSRVPNHTTDYTLRILEVDGRRLDPPPFLTAAGKWLTLPGYGHELSVNVQQLGHEIERGDGAAISQQRARVEGYCFTGHESVKYEVMRRQFNPLDAWRTGRYRDVRVLATFQTGPKDTAR